MLVGERVRAPRWMQRTGLEWVARAMQEPRRLGGRYVHDAVFSPRPTLESGGTRDAVPVPSRDGWTTLGIRWNHPTNPDRDHLSTTAFRVQLLDDDVVPVPGVADRGRRPCRGCSCGP